VAAYREVAARGNNGNVRRSLAFGQVFGRERNPLNDAPWATISELTRTLLRVDSCGSLVRAQYRHPKGLQMLSFVS
jgi:hypothetical protein